jgi:putative transposase
VSRYRCIVAERATYPVRLLCRALGVSASGFYAWWRRGPSDREREDHALLGWIRAIHGRSLGTYGSPRVHAELQHGHDIHVGRKRVERLMRADGLSGRHLRRRRGLTKQDRAAAPAPDLIGRDFSPTTTPIPGARMVGDITYLATGEGWLYLADTLDLATRSVLGYAMADHMRASLVVDALSMTATRVQLPEGAIFHSDRGSQYTSLAFARACDQLGITRSMGRTGSCFDNAAAESFWGTLKRELGRSWWCTRADARRAVFQYISVFYNRQRRHSALGYLTPQEAINRYRQRQVLAA